jgi:putative methionine-R-sulfoxide reductase with GAF domain
VKRYSPTHELLTNIERILHSNRPSLHGSPLDKIVDLLHRGRHYKWTGIYVAVGPDRATPEAALNNDSQPAQIALSETRSKILVSMQLTGREYGILAVESEREEFRPEDRIFLENVAYLLARFLAGTGRYLVRKASGTVAAASEKSQAFARAV